MKALKCAACVAVIMSLCALAFGQGSTAVSVTTNARTVLPTADLFIQGGKIVLLFAEPFSPSNSGSRISIMLDNTKILYDTSNPPRAYLNQWSHHSATVVCTAKEVQVLLEQKAYAPQITSVTIESFSLDLLQAPPLAAGEYISANLSSVDDSMTFTNPVVRIMRVGAPPSRR